MSLGANEASLEMAELEAFRDMYAAVPPDAAGTLGVGTLEIGGALCMAVTALPGARTFNRVAGLGMGGDVENSHVDAIVAFYASLRTSYVVSLSPSARAAGVEQRLRARGYEPDYPWMKFARPVSELPEAKTELRVERVGPDRGADFGRVVAAGFGLPDAVGNWCAALAGRPGWHCFVAYEGDDPAGSGALFVEGTTGWLGMGATMPDHRRKGAQGAILAARIAAAAEAGCDVVSTETGAVEDGRPSNSYRNILRSGFEETYERPNLRNPEGG